MNVLKIKFYIFLDTALGQTRIDNPVDKPIPN